MVHFYFSLPIVKGTCAIKEWWFAPNIVEHYLSDNLSTEVVKPSQNGDHGSNTT